MTRGQTWKLVVKATCLFSLSHLSSCDKSNVLVVEKTAQNGEEIVVTGCCDDEDRFSGEYQVRRPGKDAMSISATNYRRGMMDGASMEWLGSFDTPVSMTVYRRGHKHGISNSWYTAGTPRSSISYRAGRLSGLEIEWWENGIIKNVCQNLQGYKEGICFSWHASGVVESMRSYLLGVSVGEAFEWDEKGKLVSKLLYCKGGKTCEAPGAELVSEYRNETMKEIESLSKEIEDFKTWKRNNYVWEGENPKESELLNKELENLVKEEDIIRCSSVLDK